MESFLKRTPAISRALGDLDFDSDSDSDDQPDTCIFLNSNDSPVDGLTLFANRPIKHVIIATDPINTAFIMCGLQISSKNLLGELSCDIAPCDGIDKRVEVVASIYHLTEVTGGAIVLTLSFSRCPIHHYQKVVAEQLLSAISASSKVALNELELITLSAQPVHKFQSHTVSSQSFLRVMHANCAYKILPPFHLLEQPNIVTGMAAEFFTQGTLRAMPSVLIMLYYVPQDFPTYAWQSVKELLNQLSALKHHYPVFDQLATGWDANAEKKLKTECISLICGSKPNLMDQMYT